MRKLPRIIGVGVLTLGLILNLVSPVSAAGDPGAPVFREINITGDEFLVIQNPGTMALELGDFWVGYNSDSEATAGPSEQLPDVTLGAGEAIILSGQPVATCGAAVAGKLPFTLANTSGTVALWRFNASAQPATFSLISALSWNKSGQTASNHLNIDDEKSVASYASATGEDLNASWLLPEPAPSDQNPAWQVGNLADCAFTPVDPAAQAELQQSIDWPPSLDYPPFTMLPVQYASSGSGTGPSLPAVDAGLKAPMINELLPNPASPETDADDEFVELYNPNAANFDLTGFQLEAGSTTSSTRHHYTFPAGTIINSKSFRAFKSGTTGLELSNSGGQIWLLDPFGKAIASSDVYGNAKDGQAFVMAGGKWFWTLLPTPGAANSIQQPAKAGSGGSTKTATVKGKPVTAIKGTATSSDNLTGTSADTSDETPAPIHPVVLAAVAVLALAYGLYEYRSDLSNKLYQLRKYRAARRAGRH